MDGIYLKSGRFVSAEDAAELTRSMIADSPTSVDTRGWTPAESVDFCEQMAARWTRAQDLNARGGRVYLSDIVAGLIR